MPKSKHGRGKHAHRNKIKQRPAGAGLPQQAAQNIPVPAAAGTSTVPVASAAPKVSKAPRAGSPVAATVTIERSYVLNEIKRIGILTGIAILVLIILTFALK